MKRLSILSALTLLIGTLANAPAPAADTAPADPLAGKRFLSVEKLTGGERRDGTVNQIHWVLTFQKDKTYTWLHHDVISLGKYRFDAETGVLTVGEGDSKIEASFDAKTGVLTWAKQKYKVVQAEK